MASLRELPPIAISSLCLTLFIAGCGGGSDGGEDDRSTPGDTETTLDQVLAQPLGQETTCSTPLFSKTAGVPGDEVVVTGLPQEMDTVSLRVIFETDNGETLVDPLFVRVDDETDQMSFAVPVHPTGNPEGGKVQLEPGDGDLHCPGETFTIEALPPAPEDYPVTIADQLEDWVDAVLVNLGYDPPTILDADAQDLPQARWNLWLAKQFVSGDRDGALPDLAEKARDSDNDLMARLLKASDLEQDIDRARNELASADRNRLEPRSLSETTTLTRSNNPGIVGSASGVETSSRFSPGASCEEQSIAPDELEINSTSELSSLIQEARAGSLLNSEASGRAGQVLGGASLTLSGTAGDAAGHAGTAHFVATTVDAAQNALKPQQITEFEVGRVGSEWVEDRPADDTLFWDQAEVQAKGNSINVSAITLQSLVTAGGMASGPIGSAITAASTVAPDAINGAIEELTGESCVRIRAPEYGPFNVNDQQWTEVELLGSTVELAEPERHREYRGVDIGTSELEISLKEEPFALSFPMREQFAVDVVRVNTSLSPSSVNLTEPGELVELAATATNPYLEDNRNDFTAELTPESGGTLSAPGPVGNWFEVDYDTPEDRDSYPHFVEFTANHKTLPEGSGRTYQAKVDIGGDVGINESNVCLNPMQEQSFTATLDGFTDDNETVNWTASAGTITSTGALTADYTAPSGTGEVEITATADSDGEVTDTLTIAISQDCIRKLWVPSADIVLDGGGNYPDEANNCGTGDHDDVQEETLKAQDPPTDVEALLDADDYWFSRTETITASFFHNSERFHYDSDNDECLSNTFEGNNNTTLAYSADPDGTLTASLDTEMQIECQDYGDGTIECVESQSLMDLGLGGYVVEVDEEQTLTLEGELVCSGLEGLVGIGQGPNMGLAGRVLRFEDGEPWTSEDPDSPTGIENPDGSLSFPPLFELTCDEPSQSITINEEFVITEPPENETHEVVVFLQGRFQALGNYTGSSNLGTPEIPMVEPEPGIHNTSADIDFSIKLSPD